MPAKSQAQQKLMGLVHAIQQGKAEPSGDAGNIAKTMDPDDVKDFASTSHEGLPQHTEGNQDLAAETIAKYNEYGKHFQSAMSMGELAERLMAVAEYAEQAVMNEADDWFDGHTIQRNMKEMKGYVKEFAKVAQEHDGLRQRMSALYDDMGRVLERYFDISEAGGAGAVDTIDNTGQDPISYDTGEDEIEIGNSNKNPVPPDLANQMAHEDDGTPHVTQMMGTQPSGATSGDHGAPFDMDQPQVGASDEDEDDELDFLKKEDEMPIGDTPGLKRAKNLSERIVKLAREQLKGDQLVRFDTLPREIQIRAAWKVIR